MRIAIIGGGFSGTMLAVHLLKLAPHVHVTLIESQGFCRGAAYSTTNPHHLLNVPASGMSAFADQPDHFLAWAQARAPELGLENGSYAPRMVYGAYVEYQLAQAQAQAGDRLQLVQGRIVKASRINGTHGEVWRLDQADGTHLDAEYCVLATGNPAPTPPPFVDGGLLSSALFRADPWKGDAPEAGELSPDAAVLLVGTGLTMVDVVISLLDAGHRGPIHALSRHGWMPLPHMTQMVAPHADDYPDTVLAVLRRLRADAARAQREGLGWQAAMEWIRPHIARIWQRLDAPERQRFLRHMRRFWDVHRHRIAPHVADRLALAQASGQLQVWAGHLRSAQVKDDVAEITFLPRHHAQPRLLSVGRVVNCVGPATDYRRIADPLVEHLLRDGVVRTDALRLGLDVDAHAAMLGRDGIPTPGLFALGPLTRGRFWEIIAVPDIRQKAQDLATHLVACAAVAHEC